MNETVNNISCSIAGVKFKNPVIAASGTFGYAKEYNQLFDVSALGGICTKGLTLNAKEGNCGERIWETPSGLINSIGMENPGIKKFITDELPAMKLHGNVIIANLGGSTIDEYVEGAKLLCDSCKLPHGGIDMIELNISCPNVKEGGMLFGLDPCAAGSVVSAVKGAASKPLIVKLSPNAPDLSAVAKSCEENGADALSLTNTFNAIAIDIQKRQCVFNNIKAGLSGPAIRPIALRMVWDVCRVVNIPVIGIGGIDSADAAIEFFCAGAAAIQVGSATFSNPFAAIEIINGLKNYMRLHNIKNIAELRI